MPTIDTIPTWASASGGVLGIEVSFDQQRILLASYNTVAIHKVNYPTGGSTIAINPTPDFSTTIDTSKHGGVSALIQLEKSVIIGCENSLLKIINTTTTGTPVYTTQVALPGVGIGNQYAYWLNLKILVCVSSIGIFAINTGVLDDDGSIYVKNIDWSIEQLRVKSCDPLNNMLINETIRIFEHNQSSKNLIEITAKLTQRFTGSCMQNILSDLDGSLSEYLLPLKDDHRISFVLNIGTLCTYFVYRHNTVIWSTGYKESRVKIAPNTFQWYGNDGIYHDTARMNTAFYDKIDPPSAQLNQSSKILLMTQEGDICYSIQGGKEDIFHDDVLAFGKQYSIPVAIISPQFDDPDGGTTVAPQFVARLRTRDSYDKGTINIGVISGARPLIVYDPIGMQVASQRYVIRPYVSSFVCSANKFGQVSNIFIATTANCIDIFYGFLNVSASRSSGSRNSMQLS
ncbi:MAG: hypothetical protein ACRCX2_04840 [Paraclostridium sp.]